MKMAMLIKMVILALDQTLLLPDQGWVHHWRYGPPTENLLIDDLLRGDHGRFFVRVSYCFTNRIVDRIPDLPFCAGLGKRVWPTRDRPSWQGQVKEPVERDLRAVSLFRCMCHRHEWVDELLLYFDESDRRHLEHDWHGQGWALDAYHRDLQRLALILGTRRSRFRVPRTVLNERKNRFGNAPFLGCFLDWARRYDRRDLIHGLLIDIVHDYFEQESTLTLVELPPGGKYRYKMVGVDNQYNPVWLSWVPRSIQHHVDQEGSIDYYEALPFLSDHRGRLHQRYHRRIQAFLGNNLAKRQSRGWSTYANFTKMVVETQSPNSNGRHGKYGRFSRWSRAQLLIESLWTLMRSPSHESGVSRITHLCEAIMR